MFSTIVTFLKGRVNLQLLRNSVTHKSLKRIIKGFLDKTNYVGFPLWEVMDASYAHSPMGKLLFLAREEVMMPAFSLWHCKKKF